MTRSRWAWAEIDLAAVDHNVRVLRGLCAPAALWAVVKANGYGHGAIEIARQALDSGAAGLCVALVAEGVQLREGGIDAPILVLSEQPPDDLPALVANRLTATVYSVAQADALAAAADAAATSVEAHFKVDTGMHRAGIDPGRAVELARHIAGLTIEVTGVFTHLACADQPDHPGNQHQLHAFDRVLADLESVGLRPPIVHAANSAAAIALPDARRHLVRAGIAIYGISPGPGVDALARQLRPVMTLKARVSRVQHVEAGSCVSYGWRHQFRAATTVATVPIGYADGVPRRLGTLPDAPGVEVLIEGRRCPIVGVVTMDQLMVDVGSEHGVSVGDEVVLIGTQGAHTVTATDWADRLGTIGYEVVCGVSARVPRRVLQRRTPPSAHAGSP